MYEVEVKVSADVSAVRERLIDHGAEARGTETQVDTYYDHPSRSFAETDEALRIRRVDGAATVTYKGARIDDASKTRAEIQTVVEDGDAAAAILEALGFEAVADVRKERERYRFEGYTVTLDRVEGAGEFVEVETTGDEAEIESLRDGAYDVLRKLDLDPERQIPTSYLELVLADGK